MVLRDGRIQCRYLCWPSGDALVSAYFTNLFQILVSKSLVSFQEAIFSFCFVLDSQRIFVFCLCFLKLTELVFIAYIFQVRKDSLNNWPTKIWHVIFIILFVIFIWHTCIKFMLIYYLPFKEKLWIALKAIVQKCCL